MRHPQFTPELIELIVNVFVFVILTFELQKRKRYNEQTPAVGCHVIPEKLQALLLDFPLRPAITVAHK